MLLLLPVPPLVTSPTQCAQQQARASCLPSHLVLRATTEAGTAAPFFQVQIPFGYEAKAVRLPLGRRAQHRATPLGVKGLCSLPGPTAHLESLGEQGHISGCPSGCPNLPHLPVPGLPGPAVSPSLPSSWPQGSSAQGSSPLSIRLRMSGLEMA